MKVNFLGILTAINKKMNLQENLRQIIQDKNKLILVSCIVLLVFVCDFCLARYLYWLILSRGCFFGCLDRLFWWWGRNGITEVSVFTPSQNLFLIVRCLRLR